MFANGDGAESENRHPHYGGVGIREILQLDAQEITAAGADAAGWIFRNSPEVEGDGEGVKRKLISTEIGNVRERLLKRVEKLWDALHRLRVGPIVAPYTEPRVRAIGRAAVGVRQAWGSAGVVRDRAWINERAAFRQSPILEGEVCMADS